MPVPKKPATARTARKAPAKPAAAPKKAASNGTKGSRFKPVGTREGFSESAKKGSGQSNFLVKIPAEDITIRFLHEPEEWVPFYEWWDGEGKNAVKHVESDPDDGPEGVKITKRWAACAVDVDEGQVIAIMLPNSVALKLDKRVAKFGTAMDRNYTLGKSGEGLGTEYEVSNNPKIADDPMEWAAQYEMIDLAERIEMDGSGNAAEAAAAPKSSRRKAAASTAATEDEGEADDDDTAFEPADDDGDGDDEPSGNAQVESAGVAADGDDEDAAEAAVQFLTGLAESVDLDPDEYATWGELAAKLLEDWDW